MNQQAPAKKYILATLILTALIHQFTSARFTVTHKRPSKSLHFLYNNRLGKIMRTSVNKKWISTFSGMYCDHPLSKRHIKSFVAKHAINIDEAELNIHDYATFNDFFIRKLKPEARPINHDPEVLCSPADGAVLCITNLQKNTPLPIKNSVLDLETFVGNAKLAERYLNGTLVIFRLAPWDCHRFHFPTACTPSAAHTITGDYESVNPIAFSEKLQPLTVNERKRITLHTQDFGDILMIPVGALCVGRIVHTYTPHKAYNKGDEVGYFAFGGSTVALLFAPNTISVEAEILAHSARAHETTIKMGMVFAHKFETRKIT